MSRKKSVLRRWDKDVYDRIKIAMPNATDSERSRALWNGSIFKYEGAINKMGAFIYGKSKWDKAIKNAKKKD